MSTPPPIDFLVIGRSAPLRNAMIRLLRDEDARVKDCLRVDQAVREAKGHLPGLILLGPVAGHSTFAEAVAQVRRHFPLIDVVCFGVEPEADAVVAALRAGAQDFLLGDDPRLFQARIEEIRALQRYVPRLSQLRERLHQEGRFEGLLSRSKKMWEVFEFVERVADTDATVLIEGETGTGKDLLARAVHARSHRTDGPYLALDCGALTETLLDSELFGHEKGAFTGASSRKIGLFEQAQEGTLFLDEIGNISEQVQQHLLRVLESGQFRRVGGTRELRSNARIIAATNSDLLAEVRASRFREDLYYRLNVIHLRVPPLRERPEDLLLLLNHFLRGFARRYRMKIPRPTDRVVDRLLSHPWPGNVRELQNLAERLVLVARDGRILPRHLPPTISRESQRELSHGPRLPDLGKTLPEAVAEATAEVEREYLKRLLEKNEGRIQRSAAQAGISRRTLHRKLQEHGLDKQEFKRRQETPMG